MIRVAQFIFVYLLLHTILLSQSFTKNDIKKLAAKINSEIKGVEINEHISARGCIAIGRVLIYQYDVSKEWYPQKNMKDIIIANYIESGISELYYNNDIDVDFMYYTGNKLRKRLSIKSNEFTTLNFKLGDYVSIMGHPKAKGVNLKLKQPTGWEIKEGDRPNVVQKFVYKTNTYLILIKDNMMFFSRNEAKELLADEDYVNEFLYESNTFLSDFNIINHKLVTVDTYPALEYTVEGSNERSGLKLNLIMKTWLIFFEDKIIFLQCMSADKKEFQKLETLYNLITNSVIFPEQYN